MTEIQNSGEQKADKQRRLNPGMGECDKGGEMQTEIARDDLPKMEPCISQKYSTNTSNVSTEKCDCFL